MGKWGREVGVLGEEDTGDFAQQICVFVLQQPIVVNPHNPRMGGEAELLEIFKPRIHLVEASRFADVCGVVIALVVVGLGFVILPKAVVLHIELCC